MPLYYSMPWKPPVVSSLNSELRKQRDFHTDTLWIFCTYVFHVRIIQVWSIFQNFKNEKRRTKVCHMTIMSSNWAPCELYNVIFWDAIIIMFGFTVFSLLNLHRTYIIGLFILMFLKLRSNFTLLYQI